jgi:8-oxo-dGTP pyrophosphatase MutT (NUDIX family)
MAARVSQGRFPAWEPEQWADRQDRLTAEAQPAAVLMPLIDRGCGQGPSLVFTKRPESLRHHPGQMSFPGGRAEPHDSSLIDTACRETTEELGIERHQIQPWLELPQYQTVSGFLVQPVLAALSPSVEFRPDGREVDRVLEVPLQFLMDPRGHEHRQLVHEGETIRFFAISFQDEFIWGATAAMVRNLYHFFCALYEQS